MAKAEICEAIQATGWYPLPERRINDDEGLVIADVFAGRTTDAVKGVAFEIQWSNQSTERTTERTQRYEKNGIRALWLMRQDTIPVSKEVPAVRLEKVADGFIVRMPHDFYRSSSARERRPEGDVWLDGVPLKEFIAGVLKGKMCFGYPDKVKLPVDLYGGMCACRRCGKADYVAQAAVLRLDRIWPGYIVRGLGVQSVGNRTDQISRALLEEMRRLQWDRGRVSLVRVEDHKDGDGYMTHRCTGCGYQYRAPLILGSIKELPDTSITIETTGSDLEACVGEARVWSFDADGTPKWENPVFRGCGFE